MFITTPENVMNMAAQVNCQTDAGDGSHYLLSMHRDAMLHRYQSRNLQPSLAQYTSAAAFMTELTGVHFDAAQAEAILTLYPQARILIAEDEIVETHVRDELVFSVAHFFCGCSWPTYGDGVDFASFVRLVQDQAKRMGYVCVER